MKTLEYTGINPTRCQSQYKKIVAAIERDDFKAAEVKKLSNMGPGKFYRAKLDYSNRLLFTIVCHHDVTYALLLEVIENHDYTKSRFLRGAQVNHDVLQAIDATQASQEAEPVRYIHPERRKIHFLDKMISFDDAQETIFHLSPPLILAGSAGSGKTALTLEKIKHIEGKVLFVTLSSFLAQGAQNLYYAHGFQREGQEVTFFSFRDFLESIRIPTGREALWRDFVAWFHQMQQQFKGVDAHQAFEEIRGVIGADAAGVLDRASYCALGLRQSIFIGDERERVYDIFEKYREWLHENSFVDLNLLASQWMDEATPQYDFVVVDEVQDMTCAQLALILKTLKRRGNFLLCGDSNQIVHPNFFSWAKIKSLFWQNAELTPESSRHQEVKILQTNFRNSPETTRLANILLKIKHARFGSIDRESNFLVKAVAGDEGDVTILNDSDAVKRELNKKSKDSTGCAVIVLRDEDKAAARLFFQTPLIFSIHEAKGLEYETIILHNFVSEHRTEFAEITAGVNPADIVSDELAYRRAKDKTDKSLEVYKFYINALYVALTRAIKNVYWLESDTDNVLFNLLSMKKSGEKVEMAARRSSLDEWQKEAHKLELQGKLEQAEAIRTTILKEVPVPWPVFTEESVRGLLHKVFCDNAPGIKAKQQLYEYACCYEISFLAKSLAVDAHFETANHFNEQFRTVARKHLSPYAVKNFKDILRQCDRYGVDYRNPMNQTPLMAATIAGNVPLVEALVERGADIGKTDDYGRNALHLAIQTAFYDYDFRTGPLATLYDLIAPPSIDLVVGERLVRIDRHLSEYFLFQTMWALFKWQLHSPHPYGFCVVNTHTILTIWESIPTNIVRPERNKRSHISSVLSRNEVSRDYVYNRHLFKRRGTGLYHLNPQISIRQTSATGDECRSILIALNLPLIKEGSIPHQWARIDDLLIESGLPVTGQPVAGIKAKLRIEKKIGENIQKAKALHSQ